MRKSLLLILFGCNLAIAAALMWSCGGQLPGPKVCSHRARCKLGYACVLGRCRRNKTLPVATKSMRVSYAPEDIAEVDGNATRGPAKLGPFFLLGKKGAGETKLLMRFKVELPVETVLQRALLVLEPMPRCGRRPGYVRLELADLLAPWQSDTVSSRRLPRMSTPMFTGNHAVLPARALRLDVTSLVRQWEEHRGRYHGVALIASGTSPSGGCYSTGLMVGKGPRLELFLAAVKKKVSCGPQCRVVLPGCFAVTDRIHKSNCSFTSYCCTSS